MHRTLASLIVALVLALAAGAPARAGDARFVMPAPEAWEGVPVRVLVEVTDASDFSPPEVPPLADAEVRVVERGRQSRTDIRNGRVSRSSTVTYAVEVTPSRAGPLDLPPITVKVDGREVKSRPMRIEVRSSDAADLLSAEIFAKRPEVWVGEPLELVLRIVVKPFVDPVHGQLNESQMWSLVDVANGDWGPFEAEMADIVRRQGTPRSHQEQRDGSVRYVYELAAQAWPPKAGDPGIDPVRIRMTYPLGLQATQGFFMEPGLRVTDARPLAVTATPAPITVRPPPEEGRPPSFAGAVGRFAIAVEAKPTEVAVGDPVTLTVTIEDRTGRARLESLLPPPLASEPALVRDFKVPGEALSGVVAGASKRFTVTVRPLRAGIEAVPPIAFSSWDPERAAYETVLSAPIPITVRPADRMDLGRIVSNSPGAAPTPAAQTQLTDVEGGLVANKPVTPALLAGAEPRFGAGLALALLAPPVAVAGAAAWNLHRRRHEAEPGRARRSGARRAAERRLRSATAPAEVAAAVTGYVEDVTGRAAGTVTRGDVERILRDAGAEPALGERCAGLLAACERARYGAHAGGHAELADDAARLVDALERTPVRSGGGR
jgi:hypothetical protein